ncbi:MAG: hypothetical protein ABGY75_03235 [Gemmataceae bacterium]
MTQAIRLARESGNFQHPRREVNKMVEKKWPILAHSGGMSFHSDRAKAAQHPVIAPPVSVASASAKFKMDKIVGMANGKKTSPTTFPTGRRAAS